MLDRGTLLAYLKSTFGDDMAYWPVIGGLTATSLKGSSGSVTLDDFYYVISGNLEGSRTCYCHVTYPDGSSHSIGNTTGSINLGWFAPSGTRF